MQKSDQDSLRLHKSLSWKYAQAFCGLRGFLRKSWLTNFSAAELSKDWASVWHCNRRSNRKDKKDEF